MPHTQGIPARTIGVIVIWTLTVLRSDIIE